MRRIVATFALVSALTTALVAQSDPVVERSALMKQAGQQFYGVINRMARGDVPFDQAKADAAFVMLETFSQKAQPLFLTKSDQIAPNSKYHASAKIWDNKKDFDEYFTNLTQAVVDNKSKTKNIDELKIAAKAVGEACSGCHDNYQVRN